MYDLTELEGAYKYEVLEDRTEFTIYPQSGNFGDDKHEIDHVLEIYEQTHQSIIRNRPDAFLY